MPLIFPTSKDGWRLDVVSLLAVIGESSMSKHAQPLTASWLCLLPRLIPAPQALIRPARPGGLPSQPAIVAGVHSAIYIQELNYFANLIHPISELKKFEVHEISITHKNIKGQNDKVKEIVTKPFSFLNFLTVGSTLLTVGLLVYSIIHQDGPACLAIVIISVTSSLVGLASYWHPLLTKRDVRSDVPPGDVVVRTRNGAFVVIHCTEEVARELYIGAEDCEYVLGTRPAQTLVGAATVLLMIGVVLVGNCTFEMQMSLGASYIALNALYWAGALLPARLQWDLETRYECTVVETKKWDSFTLALYRTILTASRVRGKGTGEVKTAWAYASHAAPNTPVWKKWLEEVAEKGNTEVNGVEWDAQLCWNTLKRTDDAENGIAKVEEETEPGKHIIQRPTEDMNGNDASACS
jgi:hypothetical protein